MTSACGVPFSRQDILPFGTALEVYVPVVIDNVQMDHWMEYLAAIVGVASGYGAEEVAFFVNDGEQFVSIAFIVVSQSLSKKVNMPSNARPISTLWSKMPKSALPLPLICA